MCRRADRFAAAASVAWLLLGALVPAAAQQTAPGAGPATVESLDADIATEPFSAFREAFDAGRYEAAVPHAQRVLELATAAAKNPADEEVQVAVMNLAMTQYLAGDYVAA